MAVLSALRLPRRVIVPEPVNGQPPMFAEGGPLAAQQHAAIAARRPRRPRVGLLVLRHLVIALVGFGCMVAAAYLWQLWAGLIATGLAVLFAEIMVENAVTQAIAPPEQGGGGR